MAAQIEDTLEKYIREQFHVQADDDQFSREVNMWELGYVDSAGVVEMIAFLEQTFDITLPEEALFDPEFTNIRGISRIVQREIEGRPDSASQAG
jgi:acyl carrier protein